MLMTSSDAIRNAASRVGGSMVGREDQPVGRPLPGWTPRPAPPRTPMQGRFCRVEALDPARHGEELFAANQLDVAGRNWTYLSVGPYRGFEEYRAWLEKVA